MVALFLLLTLFNRLPSTDSLSTKAQVQGQLHCSELNAMALHCSASHSIALHCTGCLSMCDPLTIGAFHLLFYSAHARGCSRAYSQTNMQSYNLAGISMQWPGQRKRCIMSAYSHADSCMTHTCRWRAAAAEAAYQLPGGSGCKGHSGAVQGNL